MNKDINRVLPLWAFDGLENDLSLPMVWITGARQVGKTYLTRQLSPAYYNWDTPEVRRSFLQDPYFFRSEKKLIIFDEIHKRRDWKKVLKGYYDSPQRKENFVVTGSGRMDQYQRGGDSLQGRYNLYQLWPITVDEFLSSKKKMLQTIKPRNFQNWEPDSRKVLDDDLIRLGGFPAPLLSGSETRLRRWQNQYLERLVREDVRDFSAVQRIDQMDLLARLLPERLGSPLSIASLARDIEASPVGIKSWIRLFEVLYFGFLLKPYHRKLQRAVKKESKWYFQQWTYAEDASTRFENYLAVQLQAVCSAWSEQGFGRYELYYLRDQDRREVDFLLCNNLKPIALIEAKISPQSWPSSLRYYSEYFKIPGFLVYPKGDVKRENQGWSLPSGKFLQGMIYPA